jgi:hypothetical protein
MDAGRHRVNLKPPVIEQALKDPVAGVRENAIKLAELHFSTSPDLKMHFYH